VYKRPIRRLIRRTVRHIRRHVARTRYATLTRLTLTNHNRRTVVVQVRAGDSPYCLHNPIVNSYTLGRAQSITMRTYGAYVCTRRIKMGWYGGYRTHITPWTRTILTSTDQYLSI
jgi:hypothetical protein